MFGSEYGSGKINYFRWYKPKFVAKKYVKVHQIKA